MFKKKLVVMYVFFIVTLALSSTYYAMDIEDNPFIINDKTLNERYKIALGDSIDCNSINILSTDELEEMETEILSSPGSRYIVKFKENITMQQILKILNSYNYELIGKSENHLFIIKITDINDFEQKTNDFVDYIEEDEKKEIQAVPSDPAYNDQWALPALHIPEAWNITKGSATVKIAVIDSGIYRSHEDLIGANIRNGWDFIVDGICTMDSIGHGTEVTGIIGAQTNNSTGMSGIDWNAIILPLRVVYSDGTIYTSDVIEAIYFAADLECDVINLSLGGEIFVDAENDAIQYAISKGCIVVASAGNDGTSAYNYPASYDGVISVASIDSSLIRSDFSQFNNKVDVIAPGSDIITTADWHYFSDPYPNNGVVDYVDYVYASGTSFSAPQVSGIAALAVASDTALTPAEFEELIKKSSTDFGTTGYDNYYGYGLINANLLLWNLTTSYLVINTITPDIPNPQASGATIRWTADISGGINPQYNFYVYKGSTVVYKSNWSSNCFFDWTPTQAGTDYRIRVYIRESGRLAQTYITSGYYTINMNDQLTINTITPDIPSPQASGATIRWTADISGGVNPQYNFYVYKGSTVIYRSNWSSSSFFDWTPTQAGTDYRIRVFARESGSLAQTYITSGYYTINMNDQLTINTITPDIPSPQASGATIRWTADISGGVNPQYNFYVYKGSTVVYRSNWSSNCFFDWTPTQAGTDYRIRVFARESGSLAQTYITSGYYTINMNDQLTINSITPDIPSPQASGATIRWTADISGGVNPQYNFYVYKGSTVIYRSNWSSSNFFDWTPIQAGTDYRIRVYIRESGSLAQTYITSEYYNVLMQASPDTGEWTRLNPLPQNNGLMSVTHAENMFLAVGSCGTIMTSDDGASWIIRSTGISNQLFATVYGNGTFVVVGDEGTILTSEDAMSWTEQYSGTGDYLFGITYSNNTFVAVGAKGLILTSADGTSWTAANTGIMCDIRNIAYGNNTFIAVGADGTLMTSADGTSWIAASSGTSNLIIGITYANNTFVAVGAGGTILTSVDGTSWTARTSGVSYYLYEVTYGSSMFVAVGDGGTILTSVDGTSWTARTSGVSDYLYGVAYGSSMFVVVGDNGVILTSENAVS